MSEFAGNLPCKFISSRQLGVESSAHTLPEEQESENPHNIDEIVRADTVEIGETTLPPAKRSCKLQDAPVRFESSGARMGDEDSDLTLVEKDCVVTSSDDDVEGLSAFVTERLQCLSEGSVAKLIGDGSVNVEEILCGGVGIGEDGGGKGQSVCLNVTPGGDVGTDVIKYSSGEETDRILREELGRGNITSTAKKAAWPSYSRRRSRVLSEQRGPLCNAVMFDKVSGSGNVGGAELSKGNDTNTIEGMPESFVSRGGFSALEGFAQRQANGRCEGARLGDEEEGMVRIPPMDEMFGQEAAPKEKTK